MNETSNEAATPGLGRRAFLGLGVGAGASLLLAACTGNSSANTDTLRWAWDTVTSWDPVFSSAGWDVHLLSLVYTGLTMLDQKGDAKPGLAESWQYAPDGLSVTFRLRPGLVFSDRTPLNAEAVKKNIDRGRLHQKSLIAPQLTSVKSVQAVDDRTVRLELFSPDYQLPNLLAGKTGMVVSPAAFESDESALATKPVGHGPYVLTSYVENSKATLRRNPDYWDPASVRVENFEAFPEPAESTALAGLQSGQYNVAVIPPSKVEAARAAGLEVQVIPSMVIRVLDVHTGKAPFDNPKVAAALKYALDRKTLVSVTQFGHAEVCYQPFPPGYVGHDPALGEIYAYDPARARRLLAEAGHPDGVDVTFTTSEPQGLAEQIQAQLRAVGFRVTVDVIPDSQSTELIYIQRSKALALDRFAGRDSATQAFQVLFGADGLMNPNRQTPPELAAAVAKVARTPLDDPSYPEVLRAATDIAVKTMPNTFLFTVPRILARRAEVSEIPSLPVVQRFDGVTVT